MSCPTCRAREVVDGGCLVCAVLAADDRLSAGEVEAHLERLPAAYRSRTSADVIAQHIELLRLADGMSAIRHSVEEGSDLLTIATPDRPGVLAQVAGELTSRGVNIVGGSAFTRSDGIAIDVLRVESLVHMDDEWWDGVCAELRAALDEQSPARKPPSIEPRTSSIVAGTMPTTVYVDNDPSSEFTKVEVNALDRVGLLYALTRAISSCGVDIHLASVDTAGPLAVDTFYVRGSDGSRVEDEAAIDRLKQAVAAAADRLDR